jgi:hypothetical protein
VKVAESHGISTEIKRSRLLRMQLNGSIGDQFRTAKIVDLGGHMLCTGGLWPFTHNSITLL